MKKYNLIEAPELNPDLRNSLFLMKKLIKEVDEKFLDVKNTWGFEYKNCLELIHLYEVVNSFKYYVEVHAEAQGKLKIREQTEDCFHEFEKKYASAFKEPWFINKINYLAQKSEGEQKEAILGFIKWAKNYESHNEVALEHKVIKETRKLETVWSQAVSSSKYVHFTKEELENFLPDVEPTFLKQSLKKGKELGVKGFAVFAQDEDFEVFMTNCNDREKRETLWKLRYNNQDKYIKFENEMSNIIGLNHEMANIAGYKSLSDKKSKKNHNPSPEVVEDFLVKGIKGLSSQVNAFKVSLEKYATKFGIDQIQPWDRAFLFDKYRNRYLKDYKSDEDKYPVRQTILKAVRLYANWFDFDLVDYQIPKNNYMGIPNPSQTFWRFHLKDGERDCYLDIAPYKSKRNRESFHAFCQEIASTFNNGTQKTYGHTMIKMDVEPAEKGFNQDLLTNFCHELGHAFHNLSLDNIVSVWDGRDMQTSTIEFPSQLMELISKNPWVRTHLAKHSIDQVSKMDSKEWVKKYSKQDRLKAYEESMFLLTSLWDLKLHNEPGHSPIGLRKQLLKEHKLCFGEENEPYFPWHFDSMYNGELYSYAWSVGLVEFIIDQYFTAHPKTQNFKKLVQEYKERLLSQTGQHSFKEAWEGLFYTSMEKAALQGLKIKNKAIKQGKCFI